MSLTSIFCIFAGASAGFAAGVVACEKGGVKTKDLTRLPADVINNIRTAAARQKAEDAQQKPQSTYGNR